MESAVGVVVGGRSRAIVPAGKDSAASAHVVSDAAALAMPWRAAAGTTMLTRRNSRPRPVAGAGQWRSQTNVNEILMETRRAGSGPGGGCGVLPRGNEGRGGWSVVVVVLVVMMELEGAERPRRKGDHEQGCCSVSCARTGNFSPHLSAAL